MSGKCHRVIKKMPEGKKGDNFYDKRATIYERTDVRRSKNIAGEARKERTDIAEKGKLFHQNDPYHKSTNVFTFVDSSNHLFYSWRTA